MTSGSLHMESRNNDDPYLQSNKGDADMYEWYLYGHSMSEWLGGDLKKGYI